MMDLRIPSGKQPHILANMSKMLDNPSLSDSEFDAAFDSAFGVLEQGVVGVDGLTDAAREHVQAEGRLQDIEDSELFRREEAVDPHAGFDFDHEHFDENTSAPEVSEAYDYGNTEEATSFSEPTSPPTDLSKSFREFVGRASAPDMDYDPSSPPEEEIDLEDDSHQGTTSVDGQDYDAEMPWRPSRPEVGTTRDVSDVQPGTVIDHGPLDSGIDSEEEFAHPHRRSVSEDGESGFVARSREALDTVISRWSGAHPAIRLGIPVVALLVVLGVMLSTCGHQEKPIPNQSNVASIPDTQAPEESKQIITLIPKDIVDFCPARSTKATLAFTDNPKNAWICVRAQGVDGARIEIYFDSPVVVTAITVIPGWDYVEPNGKNHWNEHKLVTKILWRIGGKQITQNINPVPSGSTLDIPNLGTVSISGVIQSTAMPPNPNEGGPLGGMGNEAKINETFAIGKIKILGYVAGK